jgi:hypothetical protein
MIEDKCRVESQTRVGRCPYFNIKNSANNIVLVWNHGGFVWSVDQTGVSVTRTIQDRKSSCGCPGIPVHLFYTKMSRR